MINMEPVLKRGLTFWDRALLPADEFTERVRLVQAEMAAAGVGALLVWGNAYEYADFAYLTGMAVGGTVIVTPEGDPAVVTSSGGRELPFLSTLTWIRELKPAGGYGFGGTGKTLRATLEERQIMSGPIGTVGGHLLSAAAYNGVAECLSGYQLEPFDARMRGLRMRKRPREVAAARAGAAAREVARAGLGALSEGAAASALAYGLGNGIGSALGEEPTISPTSDERLVDGALLSLRVLARGSNGVSFASAMVQVAAEGATRLEPRGPVSGARVGVDGEQPVQAGDQGA